MDIESGIRLASGRNSRGSAEYEQFRSRVTRRAIAHRIKWILSGRSVGEQMRQWQQALQAEQIIDAGPKRVSPLSAFQIIERKEGGMMVITTTRITQMHDIVKKDRQQWSQVDQEALGCLVFRVQGHVVSNTRHTLCTPF